MEKELYESYVSILKKELVPAMGCTEPIAIALCAAAAAKALKEEIVKVDVKVSGNIIKNAKSVIVPNTGGMKGIPAACAAGIVGGNPYKMLEVISEITSEQKENIKLFMREVPIIVKPLDTTHTLDIVIVVHSKNGEASAHIIDEHTLFASVTKNGDTLYENKTGKTDSNIEENCESNKNSNKEEINYDILDMETIYKFAEILKIEDVYDTIKRQIDDNYAISEDGFNRDYGASIGSVLIKSFGDDVKVRAKARAAAGSDARMNGSEMPVIINSGSGNQGMTVSLPVIEYAHEYNIDEDRLIRALVISNLSAIHLKAAIGRLSAYCGAVSAGASAGAGIAYLLGGNFKVVAHTIVNALAITSGIICDGAKSSCAAKIASAVDAGILGYEMYKNGKQFYGGDGIISKGVENTIRNIGLLGQEGMYETDKEIIHIMTCID